MHSDECEFEDPVLREALRRVVGHEPAPPALRSRVRALFDGNGHAVHAPRLSVTPSTPHVTRAAGIAQWWTRWQSPIYASVAAAVVVIGIGVLVLAYNGEFDSRHYTIPAPVVAQMPSVFGGALVTAHNHCAGMTDHHLAAQDAGDDLAAVQAELESRLTIPVIMTNPGQGWVYQGAGQCQVAGQPAAHLLFARGNVRISFFSVHASAMDGAADGTLYAETIDGLPMAGFVFGEALHCVIASGGNGGGAGGAPSLDDIIAIRDRMAASCGASSCGGGLIPSAAASISE